MNNVGWWLLLAISMVLVMWLAASVVALRARRRLRLVGEPDAIHYARTQDGWRLALHRYLPQNGRPDEFPIVLCHGLGANRYNMDFDEHYSLARFLRQRGHDVFVLELRGSGLSRSPQPKARWTFDDHVRFDLPAAIEQVLALTGASKVNWIGHSLGGMVMYAALSGPIGAKVNAVATVGSPSTFRRHRPLRAVAFFYPALRWVPLGFLQPLIRAMAPYASTYMGYLPGLHVLANPRNLESRVIGQVFFNLVTNVSHGVLAQLAHWIRGDRFVSADGQTDYDHGMSAVTQPMLFVGGTRDFFCPPLALRYGLDKVASEDKTMVILGRAHGHAVDYGHGDLLIGVNAPREVFPVLERFVWEHRRPERSTERSIGRSTERSMRSTERILAA